MKKKVYCEEEKNCCGDCKYQFYVPDWFNPSCSHPKFEKEFYEKQKVHYDRGKPYKFDYIDWQKPFCYNINPDGKCKLFIRKPKRKGWFGLW
jgi:hypothetical protein